MQGDEFVKRVLFVDPNCTPGSPSMKSILAALPQLVESGYQPHFWCWKNEGLPQGVEAQVLPLSKIGLRSGFLAPYLFSTVSNLYGIWRAVTDKEKWVAVFSTGFYYLGADAAFVHFSQYDWIRRQFQMGIRDLRGVIDLGRSFLNFALDLPQYWNPRCRWLLPVSRAVQDDLRKVAPKKKQIEVFPNAYSAERFSEQRRVELRPIAREKYEFSDDEVVFSFVSMGHYHRKGYWLALKALHLLREKGYNNLRFLVIGGKETTLAKLKQDTEQEYPDWSKWVFFAGMVSEVEKELSASDAFLFPSYSEAFSLVEIEASLLGLPLLLTRHHGSEMILEEGKNGYFLDFEPESMAATIEKALESGLKGGPSHAGMALSGQAYANKLISMIEQIAQK